MKNLKERYHSEIVPALKKELGYTSVMQVPKFQKIVINIGVGEGASNAKILDACLSELSAITGQKAIPRKAMKSVAGFKVREGMTVGVMVTLRGERMYDFLNKLIAISIPRIRDFRGLNPKSFDGRGNYNMGLKDQLIFPEVKYENVISTRGMNITICTSAKTDAEALALLTHVGMPFRKPKVEKTDSKADLKPEAAIA